MKSDPLRGRHHSARAY